MTDLYATCIYEPIHYYAHAVDRIATVVNEALRPILNEIKEDITLVKHNIANLSETVSHLVQDFEDHKDKTASEIANLALMVHR